MAGGNKIVFCFGLAGLGLIVMTVGLLFVPQARLWFVEPKPDGSSTPTFVNSDGNTDQPDWLVYRDEDIGIEFAYPASAQVRLSGEIPQLDVGKKRVFTVISQNDTILANFIATSKDYGEGVGEGSPYYYAGPHIDTERSLVSIHAELANIFFAISTPQIATLDGRKAISFFKVQAYGGAYYQRAYLINVPNSVYTNLIISDGFYTSYPQDGSEVNYADWAMNIRRWLNDLEQRNQLHTSKVFQEIVNSIHWQS